ncbi:hypothetical protein V8G54_037604 [Vigna mungo]|uniref:Uncharacterized protein n=1 Tax=Vigna mungo TaxID=3915 RepID=A0AAQ3MJJ5_VIGMU
MRLLESAKLFIGVKVTKKNAILPSQLARLMTWLVILERMWQILMLAESMNKGLRLKAQSMQQHLRIPYCLKRAVLIFHEQMMIVQEMTLFKREMLQALILNYPVIHFLDFQRPTVPVNHLMILLSVRVSSQMNTRDLRDIFL